MWVLIVVAVINGQIMLDALPMPDKWTCEAKGKEAVEAANSNGFHAGARCKELKIV